MYELTVDNVAVGTFPGLDDAKREAARLAGMPLLFDVSAVAGSPTGWSAVHDGHVYRIALSQGELID
jgi:hypothetical protein